MSNLEIYLGETPINSQNRQGDSLRAVLRALMNTVDDAVRLRLYWVQSGGSSLSLSSG